MKAFSARSVYLLPQQVKYIHLLAFPFNFVSWADTAFAVFANDI